MVGMVVYKKETHFYSSPFFPLRQPDHGPSTATATPSGDTTVEILGLFFLEKSKVGMVVYKIRNKFL